jgi:DNA-binding beta-propeller fold protein YncE
MTTRRDLLIIAGGIATAGGTATLSGCREPAPAAATAPDVPDVLVAESRAGLVILGGARRDRVGTAAAVRPDGGLIYAVTGGSQLVRLDPADGAPTRRTTIGGGWVPRAVSADGRSCALSRTPATTRPSARARTALLVTTDDRQRNYDLGGVVEPDAFTHDGTGLFILEWLPPDAPDRYRVRLLDLASGRVTPLLTRAKRAVPAGAEEEMRGDGRQAVLSPDRQLLYTLYTHQPGHRHTRDLIAGRPGGVHAFVHVLHLTERWAYCLDLPHPFGEGPAAGHAVAVSADGRRLAVADVTSGSIAYADAATLRIERVHRVPAAAGLAPAGDGAASLALARDGARAYVGAGPAVAVLDGSTGAVTARWSVPGPVRGSGLSRDGARLYTGGADEVVWLDAGTGAVLGRAPVDGLTALRHVR